MVKGLVATAVVLPEDPNLCAVEVKTEDGQSIRQVVIRKEAKLFGVGTRVAIQMQRLQSPRIKAHDLEEAKQEAMKSYEEMYNQAYSQAREEVFQQAYDRAREDIARELKYGRYSVLDEKHPLH